MTQKPASDSAVAIIGMACLFPKAPDLASYWANILGKVSAIGEPVASWGAERYYQPDSHVPDRVYTKAGGFLGDLYRFNALEFGIMPNTLDGQEPDHFLALKVARDALADAGYQGEGIDHTNTGIILGHSTYLHRGQATAIQHGVVLDQTVELLRQLNPDAPESAFRDIRALLQAKLPGFNADTAAGLVPNVMTGRIANRLNLQGPNYLIDAACASSLLAVQSAIEELQAGRSDLMLAGGVNASMPAEVLMVFCQLGGMSRSSRIRPFDAEADGTLLGEGLGVVALKRLADARRDGDRIYAVVRGVGQSSDGRALGLLAPRLEGEILAIQRAYRQTGVDPRSIGLLEAHGTGIPLGDKTEITALRTVLGERRGDLPRCALGSVKSMISHCIPAAGIAGLIKVALALHHKVLPPTLCDNPNPDLGIEQTPFYLNTETRPWIHPLGELRRAAVNAFGFGGINTHAVLEEYADAAPEAVLPGHPHELVLFAAASRDGLLGQLRRLADYLAGLGEDSAVGLQDIAYTQALALQSGEQRLAIVAQDLPDLARKLARALETLAKPETLRLQTRSGTFFASQPLPGKVAFMFPGEGAQYQGMLADLAMYFPVVRRWFDLWDGVFGERRDFLPSSVVFPPPTGLDPQVRKHWQERLYSLEIGSESVFIACQAMSALLAELGVAADAMVGHSSGENSALVAAGLIELGDQDSLREHILQLNAMYQDMERAGDIVTGALMTVGAVERTQVQEVVAAAAGRLHLALDNCHHQTVLFGPRDAMEAAAEVFRGAGGLCAFLPFDRAYHTPLFAPVSQAVEEFMATVPFTTPRVPVYSCASVDVFPADATAARHLAAHQWSATVRFTETVERMYADGIRHFIEVGPAGNLTAFVDDILKDRPHLAVSANKRNLPGLEQLLFLLARLFVHGIAPDTASLFRGRRTRQLDLAAPPPRRPAPGSLLPNTLPYLRLDATETARIATLLPRLGSAPAAAFQPAAAATPAAALPEAPGQPPPPVPVLAEPDPVLGDFLGLMHEFLGHHERVMLSALAGAAQSTAADSGEPPQPLPFIERIVEQGADRVVAECDFVLGRQVFLRHHVLYATEISDIDPQLCSLPVVPLTVSLEMLAEVAALLAGQPCLVALEEVRAFNWIALDEGVRTVRLEARRLDAVGTRLHAALYDGERPLLEGVVVFADQPPADPGPLVPPLVERRAPTWRDDQLYTEGMFHGPLFHSVGSLIAWDGGGIDVELADTPLTGFITPGQRPAFFLNPALLDAVGHLTAFWIAQEYGTDFSSFPSSIRRIELLQPNVEATAGCVMRGRMAFLRQGEEPSRFLEGDFDALDTQGRAIFRISGWRDRFFTVPNSFYRARTNPRGEWYGEDWSGLFPHLGDAAVVWHVPAFPAGFLEDAGAVWKRLLAFTLLSTEERAAWFGLPQNPRRTSEWLMGRIALKEAARYWIWRHTGQLPYPADMVIRVDEAGKPRLAQELLDMFGQVPEISVAHVNGAAIAVAASMPVGIDMERFGRIRLEDFLQGAFTAEERDQLRMAGSEARVLRAWCAKEATAKCVGTGLNGRPHSFQVQEIGNQVEPLRVVSPWGNARVAVEQYDGTVIALARMEN